MTSSNLSEFDKKLENKEVKQSLISSLKETFTAGVNELTKATQKLFLAPDGKKNQITKQQDEMEDEIIEKRKN